MASAPGSGSFDIGRAFSTAFRAVFANFPLYLALGAVFVGVPLALLGSSLAALTSSITQGAASGAPPQFGSVSLLGLWALLLLIGSVMLQAALMRATIEYLSDRSPSFGDCVQVGLRSFLPLIGIAIIMGLGIFFGMILLIIPGIILYIMWSVAVPVHVEERLGVFDSLGRSRALTKGSRWSIFGLVVAMTILNWVLQTVLQTVGAVGGVTGALVLGTVGSLIGSLFSSTLIGSIYVELRTAKEGANVSDLAAIFA
jgi:hypothetical protein